MLQLTGFRVPLLNSDLSTELFKTVYIGHPSCQQFDGKTLAKEVWSLCSEFGFDCQRFLESFVGSCWDGQYVHLSVVKHIGKELVIR